MSLNKAMLIGNVGRDPEVRYLEGNNGAKVATFTLATTERYRDRNGETRENTEWHNIVAWRNTADVVEKFVRKGTQLYISFTNFTSTKKLEKVGKLFRSTKGDGHGFGLVRIDNIIERLDGYLSRNSEDGAFTTEILIPQV